MVISPAQISEAQENRQHAIDEAAYLILRHTSVIEADITFIQNRVNVPEANRLDLRGDWWESKRASKVLIPSSGTSHTKATFDQLGIKDSELLKAGILINKGTLSYSVDAIAKASGRHEQRIAVAQEEAALAEAPVAERGGVQIGSRVIEPKQLSGRGFLDAVPALQRSEMYKRFAEKRDEIDGAVAVFFSVPKDAKPSGRGLLDNLEALKNSPTYTAYSTVRDRLDAMAKKAALNVVEGIAGRN